MQTEAIEWIVSEEQKLGVRAGGRVCNALIVTDFGGAHVPIAFHWHTYIAPLVRTVTRLYALCVRVCNCACELQARRRSAAGINKHAISRYNYVQFPKLCSMAPIESMRQHEVKRAAAAAPV